MNASMELSDDQEIALHRINEWRCDRKSYLTMGGYAGTGKTTIIAQIAAESSCTAVAALCGKAAHVLRSKGVEQAQTLHSLMYIPFEDDDGRIRYRRRKYLDGINEVIVDEASMIDHLLFADLMDYGVPVLFVGDHGQLEPIGTNPKLMENPTVRLEQIHRQAQENPILRLATAFREGRRVPYWKDPKGRLEIVRKNKFQKLVRPGVQIICGFNATRHAVNKRVREMLGFKQPLEVGDRLICLKNNKEWHLFNGQQVTVSSVHKSRRGVGTVTIVTDEGSRLTVPYLVRQLGANLIEDHKRLDVCLFDYGYCITAHKSQGSEWDDVLILEEIASAWTPERWRYTAVTRAAKRLTYCG